MEVFSAVSFGDAQLWLDLLHSRYPPSKELSKSCFRAPGRPWHVKGFLIPSVTHSFLQGFQKSHNPFAQPWLWERSPFVYCLWGSCACSCAGGSTSPSDWEWDLPMARAPFFKSDGGRRSWASCPFAWSVLLEPAGGHVLLNVPLDGLSPHSHHQRDGLSFMPGLSASHDQSLS